MGIFFHDDCINDLSFDHTISGCYYSQPKVILPQACDVYCFTGRPGFYLGLFVNDIDELDQTYFLCSGLISSWRVKIFSLKQITGWFVKSEFYLVNLQ